MDKPKCYGKYPLKGNPGKVCRACPMAKDCKRVKPTPKKTTPKSKVE